MEVRLSVAATADVAVAVCVLFDMGVVVGSDMVELTGYQVTNTGGGGGGDGGITFVGAGVDGALGRCVGHGETMTGGVGNDDGVLGRNMGAGVSFFFRIA